MHLNPGVEITLLVVKYDLRVGFWIMPISINNPNTIQISPSVTGFHALAGDLTDSSRPLRIALRICLFL
jgi:hypothetical protein